MKQLLQEGVSAGLWPMEIIAEKNSLMKELIKLEEKLVNSIAKYNKIIDLQIKKMEKSNEDLFDKETRLEYVENLQRPDEAGSARNRF